MKNSSMHVGFALVVLLVLTQSAMATPFAVPDGGSSALMLLMGTAVLGIARKVIR